MEAKRRSCRIVTLVSLMLVLSEPCAQAVHSSDAYNRYIQGNNTDEAEAIKFLEAYDREASRMCNTVMNAQWEFNTNITTSNKQKMVETQLEYARFQKEVWQAATSFTWKTFRDPLVRRQFRVLSVLGRAALPDDKLTEMQELLADMRDVYSRTRVCPYIRPSKSAAKPEPPKCNLALEPDLTRIMSKSKDTEELRHVWQAWHDSAGRPLRPKFLRYIRSSNQVARLNGFKDLGEMWRAPYETEDFSAQLEDLWKNLNPMYQQLHAYVRRKIRQHYGPVVSDSEAIPAHLLGNMWAQDWTNIYSWSAPYSKKPSMDVTSSMMKQEYTSKRIYQTADSFFVSLGLKNVPESFWKDSMLEKPAGREVVCYGSAWDFCNGRDYRIKHCAEVTMDDFVTAHHEMGHVQYYMQYAKQPLVFREGANPGFHEAIGDAIALSVSTPKHLQNLGLLENAEEDRELEINYLYSVALDKLAFLPFGYLLDQWRWRIFSGEIPTGRMNAAWWEMRLKYQGVVPPVNRTEEDFDPGAKYHVAANTPYIRYFVSFVLQFQIHQALCDAAGYQGPLHKCNIHNSKEAGKLLSEVLQMGSSKPWPEVIRMLTRGRTERMDAGPVLEFFKPLHEWLKQQNKGDTIGWKGGFATVEGRSTSGSHSSTVSLFSLIVSALFVVSSRLRLC